MIVKKALYGLKSSGAAFRAHLAETLYDLNYKPTKADPDVWIRPAMKADGFKYYEMVLVYVDDILCVSHDPKATMLGLQTTFKLKDDKVEKPEMYLGAELCEKILNGVECWTMSSEKYVKAAVAAVEAHLDKLGQRLPTRCDGDEGGLSTGTRYHGRAQCGRDSLLSRARWNTKMGDRVGAD
ncbi:hypothetical protein MHU86_23404 [Fragilaria crotonensis]|nr:hypothetical protein MHU86_23404 [Fragilaria crotonensis]